MKRSQSKQPPTRTQLDAHTIRAIRAAVKRAKQSASQAELAANALQGLILQHCLNVVPDSTVAQEAARLFSHATLLATQRIEADLAR